jgi:hypothetical protein
LVEDAFRWGRRERLGEIDAVDLLDALAEPSVEWMV